MKLTNIEGTRHWYGFFLSLTTAVFVGGITGFFNAVFRKNGRSYYHLVSFFCRRNICVSIIIKNKSLPRLPALGRNKSIWLLVASLFLVLNFVANVQGLRIPQPRNRSNSHANCPFYADVRRGGVF